MTFITYKDMDTAKIGDIIVDGNSVSYITDIHERGHKTNQLTPERRFTVRGYSHEFTWKSDPGAGYIFDCFKDGSLPDADRIFSDGQTYQQYFNSVKAKPTLIYHGIKYYDRSWNNPGSIKCECGNEVVLERVMTNTCDKCHRDYSISGQLLAPRSQWGEETGESLSDILNADWGINDSAEDALVDTLNDY